MAGEEDWVHIQDLTEKTNQMVLDVLNDQKPPGGCRGGLEQLGQIGLG
jgi:hypothetical protein